MSLKDKFRSMQENRRLVQEREKKYKELYQKAYEEAKIKELPKLAEQRVKREMEHRLNGNKGNGSAMSKVGKVLKGGSRLSEALVGKPGDGIPTPEDLKKRNKWLE